MKKKLARMTLVGALAVSAAAFAAGSSFGTEKKAPDIINNTPASNPGPGAGLQAADENGQVIDTTQVAEDRYVDLQPVKKLGTIKSVDQENGRIVFLSNEVWTDENGKTTEGQQEIVLNYSQGVPIIDAQTGFPADLTKLKEGDPAYVWTAQMMTMSLPPQTPLQAMVVNLVQDAAAPQYVIVKKAEHHEDGSLTITDQDGNQWNATGSGTTVLPYLTRQMIYLSGIEEGAHCMIYPGAAMASSEPPVYTADKIVVFNW